MNILVYGAGVLGSLYAARLQETGCNVSLLARGQRLIELREHGIVLEDARSGQRTTTPVNVVERLAPEDSYDLLLVVMRRDQVPAVLPVLAAHQGTQNILFMVNNVSGPGEYIKAVGRERVLLGFPGAGGTRDGHVVRYHIMSRQQQATTLGELDGRLSSRLGQIVRTFEQAGFPVEVSRNMDAWLKTHAGWIVPTETALYMAGGDNYRMARTRDAVVSIVRAVRENFRVLHALGIPITPGRLTIFERLPEPLLIAFLQRLFNTKTAELVIARHANAARDETQVLAEELKALAASAGIATPTMERLSRYLDETVPPAPDGSAEIALDWRGTGAGLGALAVVVGFFTWLLARRDG
ncbi:MAG TPA: 2-dehydropantoate 2-reductase N-terminal domain-containing protein [Ktedonobacteraceae bacterium]|nr:2-dehydropantoate 2-reductase N-terminal domain-containing protein [Ktedonobacteraceae bacterium]